MTNSSGQSSDLSPLKRAYLAIEKLQQQVKNLEQLRQEPIAVIGLGCRFPGGANSPDAFWQMLRDGVDAIREVPAERWDIDAYYDPDPDAPGMMSTRWAGFIEGVDQFDPHLFNISPREANTMDPQQRLLLEVAWEALEHAGQAPDKLSGSATGVFMGITGNDYAQMQMADGGVNEIDTYYGSGVGHSMASGRISYVLGLQGPSVSIDTACSSSLVAIHLACQSLRNGECRQALAGGANAILAPETTVALSKFHMMAPDGRCKTFDARADGFVRGEGCGVVVLKRLSDALADGDAVLAVVRGTAVNQDGPSSGLTAPNGPAQEAVIKAALQNASLPPGDVSYIETHGTGTALGDPIEVQALGATLGVNRPADQPLLLGSVKTNIGHLESTAGVAGFIKLVLAVQHGEIPPNLHFETPNPLIPWGDWPLAVPTKLIPWQAAQRVGAVSSFGFSGTNAHIIVGQADLPQQNAAVAERPLHLLTLSAQTEPALTQLAGRWAEHLAASPAQSLADVVFTANNGRAHLPLRLGLAVATIAEAQQKLAAIANGDTVNGVIQGRIQTTDRPKIAFLFTGQGAQYPGMGRQLYETQPVSRAALDRCDEILRPYLPQPLLSVIFDEPEDVHQTQYTQPALFAIEYALFMLWQSWGVQPTAVMGHSVGEYVAACVAGVFSLEDGLKLIAARGRLMQALPAGGAMAAIFSDEVTVRAAIAAFTDVVSIAAVNGPQNVVISGKETAVTTILEQLTANGIKSKPLTVSHAFHSPLMEPMLAEFAQVAAGISYNRPKLRLISNVTGQPAMDGTLTQAAYWRDHVRQPVQFQAAMTWLHDNGYGLFLEVGPHPTLLGMGRRCLPDDAAGLWLPSLRRGRDDWQQLLTSLADLFVYGVEIDWAAVDRPYAQQKLRLPTYPFQHRRYWIPERRGRAQRPSSGHPLLGNQLRSALQTQPFEAFVSTATVPVLNDHRVHGLAILPATGYVEMMVAAATAVYGPGSHAIEGLTIHEPLVVGADETRVVHTIVTPAANQTATVQIFSQPEAVGPDAAWQLHADGRLQPNHPQAIPTGETPATLQANLPETVTAAAHYAKLDELGLNFGPSLHGVQQLWRRDGAALGQLELPASSQAELSRYQVHPALLDACLQVMAAAIPSEMSESDIFMPLGIDRFVLYQRPGGAAWSYATVELPQGARHETLTAQVKVLDENGRLLAEATGIHLKRASREVLLGSRADELADWLYRVEWQPAPLPAVPDAAAADFFPAVTAVAAAVDPQAEKLFAQHNLAAYQALAPLLDELSADSILAAWQQLGWQPQLGAPVTAVSLVEKLTTLPEHTQLIGRFLEILAEDGWFTRQGESWTLQKMPERLTAVALEARWQAIGQQFPQFDAEIDIAHRCGQALGAALSGQADPLQLLFPGGDLSSTVKLYQESPFAKTYSGLVGQVVAEALADLPGERPLRVLEVGGGTGGTSSYALPQLPADRSRYVFTDMSPLFLDRAKQKFAAYSFMDFRLLNIENDPAAQGFAGEKFDLIVAANVIHATADLRQTLGHVQQLLAPGGLLLLLEMTQPIRWIDLSFGLTDGWWRFVDRDVRPSYPLLTREGWLDLLAELGFAAATAVPHQETLLAEQAILLARQPVAPAGDITGSWLIFADEKGVGAQLVSQLELRGAICKMVRAGTPNYAELLTERPYQHIVHLWSLDATEAESLAVDGLETAVATATGSVLHLVQAITQAELSTMPRLWLVTAQTQPVDGRIPQVAQVPLWGLGKTIGLELPELHATCIDLASAAPGSAAVLLNEILANDGEPQVAYQPDQRLVSRLVPHKPAAQTSDDPLQLTISQRGVLDNLRWQPTDRRSPGPNEVEIRVLATGLNFKDVLNTLGMYPGDPGPLGGECAGVITAVGANVTEFSVGDAVLALAGGSFRTHVITAANMVAHKPRHLSFSAAATVPIPYLTAAFTLEHLGHMQAGETVLIHAAAGGVGMAAVHLAKRAGATIFATAGSPEKRAFLRDLGVEHIMDSRSLAFADEILALTNGQGVDLVLNSLADEFAGQSMRVLAENGRFLEIGKRGILTPEEAAQQKPGAAYHIVDWGETAQQDPALIHGLLQQIVADIDAGVLPPLPVRTFTRDETVDAFRFMAQAKHIGKIAVVQPHSQTVQADAIRPDATYLVTGGLRGLGLLVADWLAAQGARHLALVGRSRPDAAAQELLTRLEADGVQVYIAQVDVTQAAQMQDLFTTIEKTMPPLRGVIHSAGVLADGVLQQQDWDRFAHVLGPKVTGAWQLHMLTQHLPLDFFVLFSSLASLTGAAGQGAHAAANTFLDALAAYRRSLGLPGMSLNWGAWSEVGAAVRHGVFERTAAQAIGAIEPEQGLALLGRLLQDAVPQVAVTPVNWAEFRRKFGHLPFFAELMQQSSKTVMVETAVAQPTHTLMIQLAEATANRRQVLMQNFVETETRQVLGLDDSYPLDERAALSDMGLDSLMAVELKNRLSSHLTLTRPLPATLVFDYPNTAAITDFLLENLALAEEVEVEAVEIAAAVEGNGRSPLDDIDALAALSDDEVDRLFAEIGFSEEPYDE